ncbi:MAG: cupin domain-containing protein [Streptosporangiaceae bacterium]
MPKPEHEFFAAEKIDYTACAGDVPDLAERILAADPDRGVATRMLRFKPGTDTTPNGVQVHGFWEEVYILEGSITDLRLNQTFTAGMYACRPPGMPHGPWHSDDGCLTFEVRYPA